MATLDQDMHEAAPASDFRTTLAQIDAVFAEFQGRKIADKPLKIPRPRPKLTVIRGGKADDHA